MLHACLPGQAVAAGRQPTQPNPGPGSRRQLTPALALATAPAHLHWRWPHGLCSRVACLASFCVACPATWAVALCGLWLQAAPVSTRLCAGPWCLVVDTTAAACTCGATATRATGAWCGARLPAGRLPAPAAPGGRPDGPSCSFAAATLQLPAVKAGGLPAAALGVSGFRGFGSKKNPACRVGGRRGAAATACGCTHAGQLTLVLGFRAQGSLSHSYGPVLLILPQLCPCA
jgi:hypothetical protein